MVTAMLMVYSYLSESAAMAKGGGAEILLMTS
jgi:hypothetical protein